MGRRETFYNFSGTGAIFTNFPGKHRLQSGYRGSVAFDIEPESRWSIAGRMNSGRTRLAVWRRGIGRSAFVWVLLIAFALQSYLTQTHIHGTNPALGGACIVKCLEKAPAENTAPSKNVADCPLCQAIVHAGFFFAPGVPIAAHLCLWVRCASPFTDSHASFSASAHSWHSRAPPAN
jgi:hypothetical protein